LNKEKKIKREKKEGKKGGRKGEERRGAQILRGDRG